jgi:hypothetical protein
MAKRALQQDVIVKLIVGAGQASPSPPVGPALGSKGVKSMDFCKVCNIPSLYYQMHLKSTILIHPLLGIQRTNSKLHPPHPNSRANHSPTRPQLHLRNTHTTHSIDALRRCQSAREEE